MDDLSHALREFVAELAQLSPADLTPDGSLFGSGIIDSLNLLELVAFVEELCGIRVGAGDLTLDNWNTLRAIESYVARTISGHSPVFVYSGFKHTQDTSLMNALISWRKDVAIVDMDTPGQLKSTLKKPLLFGRLFLCDNIEELSAKNPDAIVAGVSPQNLQRGAAVTIGFDPEEIGKAGARIIIDDILGVKKIRHKEVYRPQRLQIGLNTDVLRKCRVEIPAQAVTAIKDCYRDLRVEVTFWP